MTPEQDYALDRLLSLAREVVEVAPRLPAGSIPAEMSHAELAFVALAFAVIEGGSK